MKANSILTHPDFDLFLVLDKLHQNTKYNCGCHVWTGAKSNSYGLFYLKGIRYRVHRVVYELLHGRLDDHLEILHICDNPSCHNPEHLQAGTHDENMKDMSSKFRGGFGIRGGHTVLTDDLVREIYNIRKSGISVKDTASRFGVSPSLVSSITTGRKWQHLQLPPLDLRRGPSGEEHGCAKLTAANVIDIRQRAEAGESYASIGRTFNVIPETVSLVARRVTWKNIP